MRRLTRRTFLGVSAAMAAGMALAGCQPIQAPTPAAQEAAASAAPPSDLTLTILFDNTAIDSRLGSGWGFAALVESGGHTLLFDTGADGPVLLDNMAELDIDPQSIEAVILSHAHDDHTYGLQALLDTGVHPKVYVTLPQLFEERVRGQAELIEVKDPLEIYPGMYLTIPHASFEQALAVPGRDVTLILTGCAHPGVVNVMRQVQAVVPGDVSMLAGGFHLYETPEEQVRPIIAELRQLGVQRVMPAHCTGDVATELFRAEFGVDCLSAGVGQTVRMAAA